MNGKELLEKDILINKIALAVKVPSYNKDSIHVDRPYHGFALHPFGSKTYCFWDDEKEIMLDEGSIIYMPKGSSYNVMSEKDCICYAINFDLAEDLFCEPFKFNPKDGSKMLRLFKEAEKAWSTKSVGYMEKCFAILSEIISVMKSEIAACYISGSQRNLIEPAIKYISEHYASERIVVSELSELCGISEVYLRRIFISVLGKTPITYIKHLRLERGYDLILSGEYSVSSAAVDCGFSDECYFSREFKKLYGFPPGQLLKNTNKMENDK